MSFGYPLSTGLVVQHPEAIFLCWDIDLVRSHLLNLGPVTSTEERPVGDQPDQGYLSDNVDGRLPDPDDETGGNILPRTRRLPCVQSEAPSLVG